MIPCTGQYHRVEDTDGNLVGFECTAIRLGLYAWPRCYTTWRDVGDGWWLRWQRCDDCYRRDRLRKWRRRHPDRFPRIAQADVVIELDECPF